MLVLITQREFRFENKSSVPGMEVVGIFFSVSFVKQLS